MNAQRSGKHSFISLMFKFFLCSVLCAAMLFSACSHAWRIAPNPNKDQEANNTTPEATLEPDATEPSATEPAATDEPVSTPEITDAPEFTPAPTDAPATTDTPAPGEETPTPTDTPVPGEETPAPTGTPAPATTTPVPSPTPTQAPTATPTPKPTPTPTPAPTPTPTPKPSNLPPFSVQSINGHGTITNSYYESARVTMVNVWATTCGPCIQEMPHIDQLAQNYANKGFKVLSVLGDSETPGCIQTALNILNAIQFNQPVVRYRDGIPQAFPASAYPTTFFIDSTGRVLKTVTASHSYEEWVGILNELGIH